MLIGDSGAVLPAFAEKNMEGNPAQGIAPVPVGEHGVDKITLHGVVHVLLVTVSGLKRGIRTAFQIGCTVIVMENQRGVPLRLVMYVSIGGRRMRVRFALPGRKRAAVQLRKDAVEVICVEIEGKRALFQIVQAGDFLRLGSGTAQRGKEHPCKKRDDRYDNEELDQSECAGERLPDRHPARNADFLPQNARAALPFVSQTERKKIHGSCFLMKKNRCFMPAPALRPGHYAGAGNASRLFRPFFARMNQKAGGARGVCSRGIASGQCRAGACTDSAGFSTDALKENDSGSSDCRRPRQTAHTLWQA